jgi:hypothetical protein
MFVRTHKLTFLVTFITSRSNRQSVEVLLQPSFAKLVRRGFSLALTFVPVGKMMGFLGTFPGHNRGLAIHTGETVLLFHIVNQRVNTGAVARCHKQLNHISSRNYFVFLNFLFGQIIRRKNKSAPFPRLFSGFGRALPFGRYR